MRSATIPSSLFQQQRDSSTVPGDRAAGSGSVPGVAVQEQQVWPGAAEKLKLVEGLERVLGGPMLQMHGVSASAAAVQLPSAQAEGASFRDAPVALQPAFVHTHSPDTSMGNLIVGGPVKMVGCLNLSEEAMQLLAQGNMVGGEVQRRWHGGQGDEKRKKETMR